MPGSFLETPIEYLKGVGPSRADILRKELQISTFGELLSVFPFRYIDRSRIFRISEIVEDMAYAQLKGKITRIQTAGTLRSKRLIATFTDGTGEIDLVWFQGAKWIADKISPGVEYIVFGKPTLFNGRFNVAHPDLESPDENSAGVNDTLRPLYPSTEKLKGRGLNSKGISKLIKTLVQSDKFFISENLNSAILQHLKLMERKEAFIQIHFPSSQEQLRKAQLRLKFEELFFKNLKPCPTALTQSV